jgi:peptidoglycan-associated lipoprotein
MRRLAFLLAGLPLVIAGCALPWFRQSTLDISGRWAGTWEGHGIMSIPREDRATADFTQRGRSGHGILAFDGTLAAESVPVVIRNAGSIGSRVVFDVSGRNIFLRHELGSQELVIEFTIEGERLIGRIPGADPPVRIVLAREKPPQVTRPAEAPKPLAAAPLPPPPPPPAPEQAAPPPPAAEPPVAAAPPPPAEAERAPAPAPTPTPESAPAERPLPHEFAPALELKSVHFAFDKADIRPEDASALDENAKWLKDHNVLVLVEGHADERGTNEYNLALGERRAKVVRDYLADRGVEIDRLNTVSYGEERPSCTAATPECWQGNRRVDFLIKAR